MKKIIIPSLLAAIVVFIWMFISWTIIPWHNSDMKSITDQALIDQMKTVDHDCGGTPASAGAIFCSLRFTEYTTSTHLA